jgi:hypothetical protein
MNRRPGSPDTSSGSADELRRDAERGRRLVEESREIVIVLDAEGFVVAASRRAREALEGLEEGMPLPTPGACPSRSRTSSTAWRRRCCI